jgi:hypothetical protein
MLNRCPSCQASVLDDDAEVCPFCGSPMDPAKAKGFKPAVGSAPVAKATPTAKSAAPTVAKTQASRPGPAKAAPPADEDPFAVDRTAGSSAITLSPKRTQQRPHKVVCPMCDTPGYAAEAASGKEVRCANPKCLVPIFRSPDFAAPKPVEPEPPPSKLPTILTFAVVGVILAGAAIWWFVLREPPREQPDGPEMAGTSQPTPQVATPETPTTAPQPVEQAPPPPSPAEVVAAALNRWPAVADDIAEAQRQPLRRRYAAESFAMAGRLDAAREQLDRLAKTRSADVFYQIPPLAELAWSNLAKGDEGAARSAFDQAAPLAPQIPRQGFDPARVVIEWSAAAARFGQEGPARELARAARDDDAGEQLLASLQAASLFSGGDLDAEYALRPVRRWAEPKTVGVTLELLGRKASDAARTWAQGSTGATARAENLAIWAEATAAASDDAPEGRIAAVDGTLSSSDPAERAYVLARAAVRLAGTAKDKAAAEAFLARAAEAAGGFPAPEPFSVSDIAGTYRAELPDSAAATLRASALAEATHAATLLGKADQAGALLAQALDHLRAAAPSPAAVDERMKELERLGISGVQGELKTALGLSNDDQAREAANAYRRRLNDLQAAAAARFDAQTELLARAAGWGLGSKVLAEAKQRHPAADVNSRELYFAGAAGGRLLAAFLAAGDAQSAQAVRAAGITERDIPPLTALELAIATAPVNQKPEALAQDLYSQRYTRVGSSEKLSTAVRVACRTLRARSVAEAFAFAAGVRDEAAREEVLRYLSVYAARAGKGGDAQQLLPKLRLGSTEEAAVLRGLVEGAAAGEPVSGSPAPGAPAAS